MYCKEFSYYDPSITYNELVCGYELNTIRIRRDLYSVKHLYSILNGKTDATNLLHKINIYVPSVTTRNKNLFLPHRTRTNTLSNSPINKMMSLYNKLITIDETIDIFFDNQKQFENKITRALVQHHHA